MDGELNEENPRQRGQEYLKSIYFDFLKDFREYLTEYLRESVIELTVAEFPVHGTIKLFTGISRGKARIKNQGDETCYISTIAGQRGYRLDPNEVVDMYVNNVVYATTISGNTKIGLIRY